MCPYSGCVEVSLKHWERNPVSLNISPTCVEKLSKLKKGKFVLSRILELVSTRKMSLLSDNFNCHPNR